jgi:tetratricopeptide (TPR) repeat protein
MATIDKSRLRQISAELSNIGADLAKRELFNDAAKIFELSVKLDLGDAVAYTNLAHAYQDIGSADQAIANYKRALRLNPNLEDAWERLGTLYASKGLFSKAITHYEHAIKLNPSDPVLLANIGKTCFDKGLLEQAIAYLTQASKLNPASANIHNTLGTAYSKQGLIAEAIAEFRLATQLDPNDWLYHSNLAAEYFKEGVWDESIEEYKQVAKLDPTSAATHNNLGAAYAQKGLWGKASKEFQCAIKLDPTLEIPQENLLKAQKIKASPKKKIPDRTKMEKFPTVSDTRAYVIFTRFEEELRAFIRERMEQAFGRDWWKQKVPQGIWEACLEKKEKRETESKSWEKAKELHPIYYAEFSNYLEIIRKEDNWKQAFSKCFPNKEGIMVKLQELNPIRNDIMHRGRLLTPRNRQKLEVYVKDILDCIRKTRTRELS